jgi:polyisoprenoid-binding protein YceI
LLCAEASRSDLTASGVGVITVDVTAIRSGLPGHDNARDGFLDTERYPRVTFVPRRLEGLPDGPLVEGQELQFKIVGDLTVRTVTREVTFDATGRVAGDTFTGPPRRRPS